MNGQTSKRTRIHKPLTAVVLLGTLWLGACQHMGPGHGWHAGGPIDPAEAREHAEDVAKWLLVKVDATKEQQAKAQVIVDSVTDQIIPLAEKHRANRQALLAELAKPSIDRARLEELRTAELQLADQASKQMLDAVVELSDVLTPEQRTELLAMAKHHRHHRH